MEQYIVDVNVPISLFRNTVTKRVFITPGRYQVWFISTTPAAYKVEVNGTVLAPGTKSVMDLPENFLVKVTIRGLIPDGIWQGGHISVIFKRIS